MVLEVEEWEKLNEKYAFKIENEALIIYSPVKIDDFIEMRYLIHCLELDKKIKEIRIGRKKRLW